MQPFARTTAGTWHDRDCPHVDLDRAAEESDQLPEDADVCRFCRPDKRVLAGPGGR